MVSIMLNYYTYFNICTAERKKKKTEKENVVNY